MAKKLTENGKKKRRIYYKKISETPSTKLPKLRILSNRSLKIYQQKPQIISHKVKSCRQSTMHQVLTACMKTLANCHTHNDSRQFMSHTKYSKYLANCMRFRNMSHTNTTNLSHPQILYQRFFSSYIPSIVNDSKLSPPQ